MRSIDNRFYHSPEWQRCRVAYWSSHPICERCNAQGIITPTEIIHHKIHLTPENMYDPEIAFGFDNLEALCKTCHNKEHFKDIDARRWSFDSDGSLKIKENTAPLPREI